MDRAVLDAFGIVPEYPDIYGNWHHLDDATARHLHRAMDVPEWASWPPPVDTVIVTRVGQQPEAPRGELELEDGGSRLVDGVGCPPTCRSATTRCTGTRARTRSP
jgi:hypothetical protein